MPPFLVFFSPRWIILPSCLDSLPLASVLLSPLSSLSYSLPDPSAPHCPSPFLSSVTVCIILTGQQRLPLALGGFPRNMSERWRLGIDLNPLLPNGTLACLSHLSCTACRSKHEQYSSTILNQLHTASSILLDDRCSVPLFDMHAPSLPRGAAVALDFREWRAQCAALVCVCYALAHQHRTALQHDSRSDRRVFSLPPACPFRPPCRKHSSLRMPTP